MAKTLVDMHHIEGIMRVIVHIEENLDQGIDLEKMAKLARISPFYFHRLFHAYMGETAAEYVKRLRLQRASERLTYSDCPVTEIALDVGYETPSAFTKVFNQIMGEAPSLYRKKMRSLFLAIVKRTIIQEEEQKMLKPEYINRKDEEVLFVRRIGDYKETPKIAFDALVNFLIKNNIENNDIKTFYSMAMDDHFTVDKEICRFDACVSLYSPIQPKGEFGCKTIAGGRYATFTHIGSYDALDETFDKIFRVWYPTCKEVLPDLPTFCEHIKANDPSIPEKDRVTKIYIPVR